MRVFSDDGKCVFDPLLMRRGNLEYVKSFGGVIAQHAQEPAPDRGRGHERVGTVAARLGLAGWPASQRSRSSRETCCWQSSGLSSAHLSRVNGGYGDAVRWAKTRGIRLTAEVTPHHLMLTEELMRDTTRGLQGELAAATGRRRARTARSIADGTIDIVATDHAPHAPEQKLTSFGDAAFGMVGLESALPVVLRSLVEPGHIEVADIARIVSSAPAAIGGILGYDKPLTVGAPANITLVDTSASRTFSADDLAGRSTNSPFIGVELPGTVEHVLFEGRATVKRRTRDP